MARQIIRTIPKGFTLVVAAKSRTQAEVTAFLEARITHMGHNYVQEARQMLTPALREAATWHMIGHLQRNKVNWAVRLFDMIQTLDSVELAHEIDCRGARHGIIMPVVIEINTMNTQCTQVRRCKLPVSTPVLSTHWPGRGSSPLYHNS